MTRLTTIDPTQATGKVKDLLDGVQKQMGMTPNLMKTMATSPAALEGYLQLSGALAHGSLSPRLREQLSITVAKQNSCEYCLSAHTAIGKHLKINAEELAQNREGNSEDPKIEAALHFAQSVITKHGQVSDAEVDALKTVGYTEGDITEIVVNVALNVLTNYFNNVAQTEIDFPKLSIVKK